MPHPQQKHLSGLFFSVCSQYFAALKIRTHYLCTFKKVEDVKRTHTKADLIGTCQMAGWESYAFTSLLGSAFLLVDAAFSAFFSVLRSSNN